MYRLLTFTRRHPLIPAVGLLLCLGLSTHGVLAQIAQTAQRSTSALIQSLRSDDAMERAAAACELGEREASDAVSPLINLLEDDTSIAPFTCSDRWYDREHNSPGREAARALVAIGDQVTGPVFAALDHALGAVREKAVWILGALAYHEASDEMEQLVVDDEYSLTRANAAWALGAMDESGATPALIEALGDGEARVREQAAWALGALDAGDAVEELSAVLRDDPSADVREQAAWALGAIGDEAGVTALVGALDDEADGVREQAAWALGAIGDEAGVDGLIGSLGDENEDVREQSAWALGAIGDACAAEALTAALEDDSRNVREQAIWALSAID